VDGIVYTLTNTVSEKQYVGQTTTQRFKRRLREHRSMCDHSNRYLYNAIKKYGWNVFDVSIIDTAQSPIELSEKEIYWIKDLNTVSPNGYNLTTGGERGSYSPDSRALMSRLAIERMKDPNLRRKLSEANMGVNNPNYGQHHSLERITKFVESCSRLWEVTDPTGSTIIVKNMNAFCSERQLNAGCMSWVASGKRQQHKGYTCRRVE
jgi:group I intron endonuclease